MDINVELIEEAKKNKAMISIAYDKQSTALDQIEDGYLARRKVFQDKIYSLEKEIRRLQEVKDKKVSFVRESLEQAVESLSSSIKKLDRVFAFMELNNKARNGVSVYKFSQINDGEKENYPQVATLIFRFQIGINLYIVDNNWRKKVNKVGLWAIGSSIFKDSIIDLPYSYGCPAQHRDANIVYFLKDFKTVEDASAFIEKHQDTILKDFLAKHKETEEDYEDVLANCNTKEWKIAFLEYKKNYYERSVSNGIDLPEYKEVLKKLKELSK